MNEHVTHAKAYPFPAPDHCFEYLGGNWRRLEGRDFDRGGRTPVLACGSNQSPEQIHRKYGHLPDVGPIPAQRGRLADFDVVYAAHLSGYGSIPATFQYAPGTSVTVFVLWLDEAQLARMHETEGNYSYDHLAGIRVDLDAGGVLEEAYAYSSKAGCLNYHGGCAALAEIAAGNRRFPAIRQVEALEYLRARIEPEADLDHFIFRHIEDPEVFRTRLAFMAADALPVSYPRRIVAEL